MAPAAAHPQPAYVRSIAGTAVQAVGEIGFVLLQVPDRGAQSQNATEEALVSATADCTEGPLPDLLTVGSEDSVEVIETEGE